MLMIVINLDLPNNKLITIMMLMNKITKICAIVKLYAIGAIETEDITALLDVISVTL